jgi:hypothetical protein
MSNVGIKHGCRCAPGQGIIGSSLRIALPSLLCVLATCSLARGEDPLRATNSRAARKDAVAHLPLNRLSPDDQARVQAVLDKTTIFRRMPTQVICCEPALYDFVADHPQILADIWQLLGIDDVTLTPESDGVFRASDVQGTQGRVEFLYRDQHTRLVYAEGTYDGPLFAKPVTGSCVMLLTSDYVREPDGKYYVTTRLDAFVRLDNAGAEFLAKTFQMLVARVADMSFVQTSSFIEQLSRAAEYNPRGMYRLADKLPHVDDRVKAEFIQLTAGVAQRAAERDRHRLEVARGSEGRELQVQGR